MFLYAISFAYAVNETEWELSGYASVVITDDNAVGKSSFWILLLLLKNVVLYAFIDSDNSFLCFCDDLFWNSKTDGERLWSTVVLIKS